jgi:DNA-directed RNA polymerase sigma subunit (sigma70/sigma32)
MRKMRAALELRWGMRGRALTYDEVAEALGVGREQARKLCAAAEAFVRDWTAPLRSR